MESFLTGAAANTMSSVVSVVIPQLIGLIDDVIRLDRNSQQLQHKLRRMKLLLQDITSPFQHDQRSPPDTVKEWLKRLQESLQDAKLVMERAQRQKGCLVCFLMRTQVREWNANFDKLLIDLDTEFSILRNDNEDRQFRMKCKRISITHNNISVLPTDFRYPNLLTLILHHNESLREVPNGFLVNLTSLRVLDLGSTKIESLPISLWHLRQLQFLSLENTLIKYLPEDICNLSQLQFLHLNGCRQLQSLPCKIGELQNLKTLNLGNCCSLIRIPHEISQLTAGHPRHGIKILRTSGTRGQSRIMGLEEVKSGVCSLKDLANCPNLRQLQVHVKPGSEVEGIRLGIEEGILGTWVEMRNLTLAFDVEDNDVVEDLPQDMQNMKKLQIFSLLNYHGRSLPNCVSEFPELERLKLYSCFQIRELPPVERLPNLRSLTLDNCTKVKEFAIGTRGITRGFPMLEHLKLRKLPMLESMGSSSSNDVWNEETMPRLQVLSITYCESLKGLPIGIEKLPNLREIEVQENWWEESISSENDVKTLLKNKIVFVE